MIDFRLEAEVVQEPLTVEPYKEWKFPDRTLWALFYRINRVYLLRFPDMADFEVSHDGLSVVCSPALRVSDATTQHLYQNQVLPFVLSRQGKLVFHASAVELEGDAIAFLGESGLGKSTLAAGFVMNGRRFLTDDGLVVEPNGHGYRILPSHPSIRLWADSEETMVDPEVETAPALGFTSKSRFLAGVKLAYCDQPRRLRTAYFLGNESTQTVKFRRLSPSEAVHKWLKNSFVLDPEDRSLIASHFDRVAILANSVPCYYLDYPRIYEGFDQVQQTIIDHAAKLNKV